MELNSISSPLQPHHVIPPVKHGGGSVMVWACMICHGFRYICRIYDSRMTALDYIYILKTELADTLDYYRLGGCDFIFQHDNDPKYIATLYTFGIFVFISTPLENILAILFSSMDN
jgi:hypothetical protein